MTEVITVKRNWNDATIRLEVNDKDIRIEAPVDNFKHRLEDILLDKLPLLRTKGSISEAFNDAFEQVIKEMKQETIKIAGHVKVGEENG